MPVLIITIHGCLHVVLSILDFMNVLFISFSLHLSLCSCGSKMFAWNIYVHLSGADLKSLRIYVHVHKRVYNKNQTYNKFCLFFLKKILHCTALFHFFFLLIFQKIKGGGEIHNTPWIRQYAYVISRDLKFNYLFRKCL